jgi:hypothetical protein
VGLDSRVRLIGCKNAICSRIVAAVKKENNARRESLNIRFKKKYNPVLMHRAWFDHRERQMLEENYAKQM